MESKEKLVAYANIGDLKLHVLYIFFCHGRLFLIINPFIVYMRGISRSLSSLLTFGVLIVSSIVVVTLVANAKKSENERYLQSIRMKDANKNRLYNEYNHQSTKE